MQQFLNLLFWRLFTAQHVSGVFPLIIRSSMTSVAASGFTFVSWLSCCVRGRAVRPAGPTTNTAWLSPRYEGKSKVCHCSHWAPDDRRENTRNMLNCKQTSGYEKLLHRVGNLFECNVKLRCQNVKHNICLRNKFLMLAKCHNVKPRVFSRSDLVANAS
jgi:hypothetical protein